MTAQNPILDYAKPEALHPAEQRVMRHMTQLDPLRAFAVMAVMVQHWVQREGTQLPVGTIGVRMFFVLSGFLITGILIKCRDLQQQTGQSVWYTAKQFYIRRFLRIFPLFYFVILVGVILNIPTMRQAWLWHVSYLSNFQLILHPNAEGAVTNHFWSLAVEEQFYLVWPWVILLVPQRALLGTIIATILIAPTWRIIGFSMGLHPNAYSFAPYACLDTLGMGALLALLADKQHGIAYEKLTKLMNIALVAGLLLFGAAVSTRYHFRDFRVIDAAGFNLGLALIFFWLIGTAARGFNGSAGKLLTLKPLIYIGAISYGVYVYHNFLPMLLKTVWPLNAAFHKIPHALQWSVLPIMAIVVPTISWFAFEKPINSLKRYFEYRKKPLAPSFGTSEQG